MIMKNSITMKRSDAALINGDTKSLKEENTILREEVAILTKRLCKYECPYPYDDSSSEDDGFKDDSSHLFD